MSGQHIRAMGNFNKTGNFRYTMGNLLGIFDRRELDVICHCANVNNTFGAGIARQIKDKFPKAYEADCQAAARFENSLGNISYAVINGGYIFNIYTQSLYSEAERKTNYEALYRGLEKVANWSRDKYEHPTRIGFPYGMGCALGGGDWTIVETMIKVVFKDFNVYIVKLP